MQHGSRRPCSAEAAAHAVRQLRAMQRCDICPCSMAADDHAALKQLPMQWISACIPLSVTSFQHHLSLLHAARPSCVDKRSLNIGSCMRCALQDSDVMRLPMPGVPGGARMLTLGGCSDLALAPALLFFGSFLPCLLPLLPTSNSPLLWMPPLLPSSMAPLFFDLCPCSRFPSRFIPCATYGRA
eukprot:276792-Chlamydomonas_euryale.AAC.5